MKIAIDENIELEFSPWSVEEAANRIEEIRQKHKERADDVLRAVLTLLLFGQLELQTPGSMQRLLMASEKVSTAMAGPKPQK